MRGIWPKKRLSARLDLRFLPVVVWLVAVAGVIGLFRHRAQRFEVLGIARGQVHQVMANCTARLKSIPVELFDEVKKGQTVAVINTVLDNEDGPEVVRTKLATILAEIDHLMTQLVPTQDNLLVDKTNSESNRLADKRNFAADVENARLQILQLRAQLASDRILLEDLAVEMRIVEELLQQEAVAPYELQKTKVQYETLAKKIQENERLLEQAKTDLRQALKRQYEYTQYQPHHASVESALDVIHKAIDVQEKLMEEVLAQLEALNARQSIELKAPFDGVVVRIRDRQGEPVLHKPGEVVLAGEPILAIAEANPREIIAYISENQAHQVKKGMAVEVIKVSEPPQRGPSQIKYVGPTIEQMPVELWRNPNIPQWGRPFLVDVPSGPPKMDLVIGERVGIRRL